MSIEEITANLMKGLEKISVMETRLEQLNDCINSNLYTPMDENRVSTSRIYILEKLLKKVISICDEEKLDFELLAFLQNSNPRDLNKYDFEKLSDETITRFFNWFLVNYTQDAQDLIRDNDEMESWLDTFCDICVKCRKTLKEDN